MTRRKRTTYPACFCGHSHHEADELAYINGQPICRCARCWTALLTAARIGTQLRLELGEPT